MTGSPVRWGILVTGLIAHDFARDLRLSESGVVSAVGSRTQQSADRFAQEYDIERRYAGYESPRVGDPIVFRGCGRRLRDTRRD